MQKENFESMTKKEKEESLTNRVLINFGYSLIGFVLLYVFYLYAMGTFGNISSYRYVMLGLFIFFAAAAVVLYVLSYSKNGKLQKNRHYFRNYGHMAVGVAIAVFYLNFAFYTQWMPIESASDFLRSTLAFLKNTQKDYIVTAVALVIYLLVIIVYNSILIHRLPSDAKAAKKKFKKK